MLKRKVFTKSVASSIIIHSINKYYFPSFNHVGGYSSMKYVRIYADPTGESHFEDVEIELAQLNFIR